MELLLTIPAILFAVVIHEYAHGWVASKRGDATARLAGRLTLNPLKHIDPVGTIIVPLALQLLHLTPVGWAKPVPVSYANLYNPRRDMVLVAAAGPAVNILAALFFSALLKLMLSFGMLPNSNVSGYFFVFCVFFIYINLLLAVFNLMPIPPMDGSRIVLGILPQSLVPVYRRIEPFGFLILIVLLNLGVLNFVGKIASFLFMQLGIPVPS